MGALTSRLARIDMNLLISYLLQAGVAISSSVILLGVLLMLTTGSTGYGSSLKVGELLAYGRPSPHGMFPSTIPQVLRGVVHLRPFAIVQLGVLLLIATPVMRVASSVLLFLAENDRLYAVITTVVLAILLLSLTGAI